MKQAKHSKLKYLSIMALSAICSVQAQEHKDIPEEQVKSEPLEPKKLWGMFGDIEAGLLLTSGNTPSNSVNFRANINKDLKRYRQQLKVDSIVKREQKKDSDTKEKTAERHFVSYQIDRKFDSQTESLFVYISHERDKFSGQKYRNSLISGYGNRFYLSEKSILDLDLGLGYQQLEFDAKEAEKGELARFALQWDREISETTRFNQVISVEKSLAGLNTRSELQSSFRTQINDKLALKVSYDYRHNSKPENDKKPYDSKMAVTLLYNF